MPIPLVPALIFAATALLGAKGTYDVGDAASRRAAAKARYERRRRIYEDAAAKYARKQKEARVACTKLAELRLRSIAALGLAVAFIKKAGIKKRDLTSELKISDRTLKQWTDAASTADRISVAAGSGTAAGVAVASATWSAVGLLASASTGTAISSLSGVAASNATLAWLGGGSLAAGGGGMALGTWVLGGVTAGPALVVAGLFAQKNVAELETKVSSEIAKLDVAEAQIGLEIAAVDGFLRRLDELDAATRRVEQALRTALRQGNPNRIDDAYRVARIAKALGDLLDVALLDKSGRPLQ